MKKNNHLALGGLFITLHLLFIFISRILVGSELLLVIFLPLLSTLYSLKFNKKETCMFLLATFFLCVIFEPIATCIYILPALICGTTYGVFVKGNAKELTLVYASSIAHSISLSISFLFISLMFKEVSFFEIFSKFIDKEGQEFYVCIYLVLVLLGLLEAFLVHIITSNELKRLEYREIESEKETPFWMLIGLGVTSIIYLVFAFINPILSCYALPYLLAFVIPIVVEFVILNQKKWVYFIVAFLLVVGIFLFNLIDLIFYPIILIFAFIPIVVEKIVRVLYTNSSKYLNNGENKIK